MRADQRHRGVLLAAPALVVALLAACAREPAEERRPIPGPSPASERQSVTRRGSELYQANCQGCHGDREGRGGRAGAPPHGPAGHTWHHPDAQLREWIMEGKPPGAMPAFGGQLADGDVAAILAFIKTWWTPEQRESQEDVSKRYEEALERQRR